MEGDQVFMREQQKILEESIDVVDFQKIDKTGERVKMTIHCLMT